MAGFGSVPGAPPSGIEVPESLPDPSRALEDIRDRYCLPTVNVPTGFSLGPLIAQRYDYRNQNLNALLITVTSGVLYGYFGDFTTQSGKTPTFPHFVVSSGVVPGSQTFPLPPSDGYIITLQEPAGSTVVGCITAQAL